MNNPLECVRVPLRVSIGRFRLATDHKIRLHLINWVLCNSTAPFMRTRRGHSSMLQQTGSVSHHNATQHNPHPHQPSPTAKMCSISTLYRTQATDYTYVHGSAVGCKFALHGCATPPLDVCQCLVRWRAKEHKRDAPRIHNVSESGCGRMGSVADEVARVQPRAVRASH